MPALPILRYPDPRLALASEPVSATTPAIRQLASDMFQTMYAAEGRGLAAPQVGVLQRLFVLDAGWKQGSPAPQVFVNPLVLWVSEVTAPGEESCLSIPGAVTVLRRAQAIHLRWTDLDGARHDARLAGFAAIAAQHEIDHLNGILTLDRLALERNGA